MLIDFPMVREVYFDDFKIEHIKSPVIQSQDFYPGGLTYNSYQRENSLSNQFQYNGKELQDELGLDWTDYGARMYMRDILRWGAGDPLADKYFSSSPYVYVLNNFVNAVDPDGKRVFFVGGAGNDQIGWNYTAKWQRAFEQGGIQGFTRINASHDNPEDLRSGQSPVGDILFTASHRNSAFEPVPGSHFMEDRYIQDDQIDNAVDQIQENVKANPLADGEQFNLAGYSYGSVLQAHVALRLANSGQKIDNLILVGSPISEKSGLYRQLMNNKNIGKIHRIDIEKDLLSNPKDILEFIQGGRQNADPNNTGEGPHFDFARPGQGEGDNNDTYKRLQQIVVEWLKQQGVK